MNYMKTFKKDVQSGWGLDLPNMHIESFTRLNNIDDELVLKMLSYDDEQYEVEYFEGTVLWQWYARNGSFDWAMDLLTRLQILISKLAQEKYTHGGVTYRMCMVDIHPENILVSPEGRAVVVDYDSFGWVEDTNVFYHINLAYSKLTMNFRDMLMRINHKQNLQTEQTKVWNLASESIKQEREKCEKEKLDIWKNAQEEIHRNYDNAQEEIQKNYDNAQEEIQKNYDTAQEEVKEQWKKTQEEIKKQWDAAYIHFKKECESGRL